MKRLHTFAKMMLLALVAVTTFSSCEDDDHYIAEQLIDRDWQGFLGAYYNDRWGLTGQEFHTVMRFTSNDYYSTSGRGYELDYNENSWHQDYAYCTFKWFIVDGEITLIYDDEVWSPIYILDYRLTSETFDGYILDNSNRRIVFELNNEYFGDWNYYRGNRGYGGYNTGGFSDQRYFRSRQAGSAALAADTVLVLDNGKSIRSGVFATANMRY